MKDNMIKVTNGQLVVQGKPIPKATPCRVEVIEPEEVEIGQMWDKDGRKLFQKYKSHEICREQVVQYKTSELIKGIGVGVGVLLGLLLMVFQPALGTIIMAALLVEVCFGKKKG